MPRPRGLISALLQRSRTPARRSPVRPLRRSPGAPIRWSSAGPIVSAPPLSFECGQLAGAPAIPARRAACDIRPLLQCPCLLYHVCSRPLERRRACSRVNCAELRAVAHFCCPPLVSLRILRVIDSAISGQFGPKRAQLRPRRCALRDPGDRLNLPSTLGAARVHSPSLESLPPHDRHQ